MECRENYYIARHIFGATFMTDNALSAIFFFRKRVVPCCARMSPSVCLFDSQLQSMDDKSYKYRIRWRQPYNNSWSFFSVWLIHLRSCERRLKDGTKFMPAEFLFLRLWLHRIGQFLKASEYWTIVLSS